MNIKGRVMAIMVAGGLAGFAGDLAAVQTGDWVIRGGPAYVAPTSDSDEVPGMPGTGVEADEAWDVGFSLGYLLTDHWSLSTSATGIPFRSAAIELGRRPQAGTAIPRSTA